ncbi:PadR family transcriptional regulator [Streptomyces sp. NRRL F-5123]|uniref:PadR family transcriptional regulator n=1 Tax=Streptomyces sp. NRRL F-5123 TaxID=1463856 RepID=UPI00099D56CE|nr:PadR family transcriptional regulator [Streptomyces sp. NRRL F-5123]
MNAVAKRRKLSNPLALAVMVFLGERPMHPYEIARLLRQRGKEHSIKINYGSLYTVVQNLEKHGFVEVAGVQRQGNRPERTLYGLTEAGRTEAHDWLADLVAVPAQEYPGFEAALSLIGALHPDEAAELLAERAGAQEVQAAALRGVLAKLGAELPRLFLIETEYQARMREAEAAWIRELLAEVAEGRLSGLDEWRAWHDTGSLPEDWQRFEEQFRDAEAEAGTGADVDADTRAGSATRPAAPPTAPDPEDTPS